MSTIYRIYNNQSVTDSDGWQYWITQDTICYHASLEGAHRHIESLLEERIKLSEELRQSNMHLSDAHWQEQVIDPIHANIQHLPSGSSGRDEEECKIFDIEVIELLP